MSTPSQVPLVEPPPARCDTSDSGISNEPSLVSSDRSNSGSGGLSPVYSPGSEPATPIEYAAISEQTGAEVDAKQKLKILELAPLDAAPPAAVVELDTECSSGSHGNLSEDSQSSSSSSPDMLGIPPVPSLYNLPNVTIGLSPSLDIPSSGSESNIVSDKSVESLDSSPSMSPSSTEEDMSAYDDAPILLADETASVLFGSVPGGGRIDENATIRLVHAVTFLPWMAAVCATLALFPMALPALLFCPPSAPRSPSSRLAALLPRSPIPEHSLRRLEYYSQTVHSYVAASCFVLLVVFIFGGPFGRALVACAAVRAASVWLPTDIDSRGVAGGDMDCMRAVLFGQEERLAVEMITRAKARESG